MHQPGDFILRVTPYPEGEASVTVEVRGVRLDVAKKLVRLLAREDAKFKEAKP
jgi:hypothetical protein